MEVKEILEEMSKYIGCPECGCKEGQCTCGDDCHCEDKKKVDEALEGTQEPTEEDKDALYDAVQALNKAEWFVSEQDDLDTLVKAQKILNGLLKEELVDEIQLLSNCLDKAGYTEMTDRFEKFVGDSKGEHVCKIYIKDDTLEFVNGDIKKEFPITNDIQIQKAFKEIETLEK